MKNITLNARCPLQAECERKCTFQNHELDCDYYNANAREDLIIEDQEQIRDERWQQREEQAHSSESNDESGYAEMIMLPIDDLHPHSDNPRKALGDLNELADSIKANGVFQNLTVVPAENGYTIIIGHRRRAAAEIAGLTRLPCVIVNMSPMEQLQTMLLENMQRSDLTVYEQAQGFQMMIELGDTVDGIAEKTGFSRTTINRRLKMAELDQSTLKDVSSRQILLSDFDRLAQIEDMTERNICLHHIGTGNFNIEVERRIKKQNIEKNMPAVKKALRAAKAKKLEQRQTWYGEYEEMRNSEVAIDKIEEGNIPIPKCGEDLFYFINESDGRLRFYKKKKRAAPVKRPQSEIDREKAMKEANEKCTELSALCQKLRADFVKTLTLNSKNHDVMLKGALSAIITLSFKFGSPSSPTLCKLAGIERKYAEGECEKAMTALHGNINQTAPSIIYAAFCDINEKYHTGYSGQFPRYQRCERLDALYDWLCSVGYEMSDDEKAMQNGTHELLHIGESSKS